MRTRDHRVVQEENKTVAVQKTFPAICFDYREAYITAPLSSLRPVSPLLDFPPFLSCLLSLRRGRSSSNAPLHIHTHWHSFRPGSCPALMSNSVALKGKKDTTFPPPSQESQNQTCNLSNLHTTFFFSTLSHTSTLWLLSGVCGSVPGCSSCCTEHQINQRGKR